MNDRDREVHGVLRNVYVCYFFSGAAGLVYQVLWLRKLLLVFGSTVHAVSTVLTVFFGGLALGSWIFGRLIDRHEGAGLRWYAALEAVVGLVAFATLPLFDVIQRVYIPIYQASDFSPAVLVSASFVCSALVLLVPTTMMGGTFPVLSRFLIRSSGERGVKLASLYAINTAGAMAGTLLVYYIGLPMVGLFRTLLCAGVLNLGIGALCLTFDRHLESLEFGPAPASARASEPAAVAEDSLGDVRWLFIAFGLSGFSAMVYEVAWTRALSLVLGSSIYAFCIMLATFLGGMAIGSFVARQHLSHKASTLSQFILIELVLGAYGLISVPLFSLLPRWFVVLWPVTGGSFSGLSWLQCTLSAFAMLYPTVLLGILFPIVSDLVTKRFAALGQRLGTAYAVNTLGGIIGSFLSGFVLIPFLGLPWAIAVAALVNVTAGCVIYIRFGDIRTVVRRIGLAVVGGVSLALISGFVVVPSWRRQAFAAGVYIAPEQFRQQDAIFRTPNAGGGKLLYYRDSFNATVSVHQTGRTISLKIGGKTDASNGIDMGTQMLSAHIPMLLHRKPESVLVIGLGSGVTLGNAGLYPVSTIHCAELDPAVIEGARFFKEYNFGIHDDPRTRIFSADGRNFLLASRRQYDVIISEPSNPWMAGLAYLFTQEFYKLAKRRLAPGGIMCQWLQLYRIFPQDVKLMLKTFHSEFPYMTVWSSIPGDLLLVGSMEPLQFDSQRLAERMASPRVKQALSAIHLTSPDELLELFWFGNREVERITADVQWVHQDDQPLVEFNAPKALYVNGTFNLNYQNLEKFKSTVESIVAGYVPPTKTADRYQRLASMWEYREEGDKAIEALEQAVALDPNAGASWKELGLLRIRSRDFLRGEDALKRAIQLPDAKVEAYRLLARLNRIQHRGEEAQRFYEEMARVKAPDGDMAQEVGDCLRENKHLALAAEYYRSAISQGQGDQVLLLIAYAKVLKELKSWAAVHEVLAFAAKQFPDDPGIPLGRGEVLLDQERWIDAVPYFDRVLKAVPNSTEAYYGLARIAMQQGRARETARLLRRGLQYNPYHKDSLELLDRIEREKKKAAGAA